MKKNFIPAAAVKVWLLVLLPLAAASCEKVQVSEPEEPSTVSLEEIAAIFSHLHLTGEHLQEVHSAVSSSLDHGYDEEYTMACLFNSPGSGVGSSASETKSSARDWSSPLRDLLTEYLKENCPTRADVGTASMSADEYIAALAASDAQIYWPYSEEWDGSSYPVITFHPGTDIPSNIGYQMSENGKVKQVVVNEEKAMNGNVWVINRNEDSGHMTLEMLRRQDPEWGSGGEIVIRTKAAAPASKSRTLILKSFEARRNYDCWFAGASEFFVKCGAVEDFQASTEAEMRLYSPAVTDFMVVVKRRQVGTPIPFNAVLVSEFTDQLDRFAFLITEDDGGTRTSWKTSAVVKIQSKSYGFDIDLPFNSRDDIVWRGMLSRSYLEKNNGEEGHFGDVYLTFAFE